MRLYHSTTCEAAAEIKATGFRDGRSPSFNRNGELCRGVWLSDQDVTDRFSLGGYVFVVDLPDNIAEQHEWIEDDDPDPTWRAFFVPAETLNRYSRARMVHTPVHPQPTETVD